MSQQPAAYYAVTIEPGVSWDTSSPMRQQAHWAEHAAFMNALEDDGFAVLGGPLDDETKALVIVKAESEQEAASRLADDPWIVLRLRRIAKIERWEILLGTIG